MAMPVGLLARVGLFAGLMGPLVASLVPAVAHADPRTIDAAFPPTVRVGPPAGHDARLDRVTFERAEDLAWLAIRVRRSPFGEHATIPVDLPAGTRVIGVQLECGDKIVWGAARTVRAARTRFEASSEPALVTWAGSSADEDHVVVTIGCSGTTTVTLALALPATTNLHVEPHDRLVVDGERATGPTSLAIAGFTPPASYRVVDARTSLVAEADADATGLSSPLVEPFELGSLDKHMIRRTIEVHHAQLRRCYMQVAQWHPEVEGKVELHFVIEEDGHVSSSTADGELANAQVDACLADEAASWTFPAARGAGAVVVNYPLELRLHR